MLTNTAATARRRGAIVAATLALVLLASSCDGDTPTRQTSPDALVADTAGVIGVATAWDAAWNAGDAAAIGALFVADAEFINGRGQIAQGAAAIQANHAASLAGVFNGSHTHGTVRDIAFLGDSGAVIDVDNELTGFGALPPGTLPTEPGVQRGHHMRVIVKRGGVWRILRMQITNVPPAP